MQPSQRRWRPPVERPEQAHERRQQQGPDQGRVQDQGYRDAAAQQLEQADTGGAQGDEHDGQEGRGSGDDPAGAFQAHRDGRPGIAAQLVFLPDPAEQEYLVVHGQPEGQAEHQQQRADIEVTGWREAQRSRQVPLLEDPDGDTEGRAQRCRAQHQGLGRDDQAAGHQEQGKEGHQRHHEQGERQVGRDGRDGVHLLRGQARHHDRERPVHSPDPLHQGHCLRRVGIGAGHHLEPGSPGSREHQRVVDCGRDLAPVHVGPGPRLDFGGVRQRRKRGGVPGNGVRAGRGHDAHGDNVHRRGIECGEVGPHRVAYLASLSGRGQYPVVGLAKPDMGEWQHERDQQHGHRDRDPRRVPHDKQREPVPPARICGGRAPAQRHREAVDPQAEQPE